MSPSDTFMNLNTMFRPLSLDVGGWWRALSTRIGSKKQREGMPHSDTFIS